MESENMCSRIMDIWRQCSCTLAMMSEAAQEIATVGTAGGRYFAHLHFEMREFVTPFIGPGYREDMRGWLDPTAFIEAHRGALEDDVGRAPLP
jgi:hypothetical protein